MKFREKCWDTPERQPGADAGLILPAATNQYIPLPRFADSARRARHNPLPPDVRASYRLSYWKISATALREPGRGSGEKCPEADSSRGMACWYRPEWEAKLFA